VPDAVLELNGVRRFAVRFVEQQQVNCRRVARVQREVHAAIDDRRAERILGL
jgi:hypothetical protein